MRLRTSRVVAGAVGVLAVALLARGFVTGEYQQAIGQVGSDVGWNNTLGDIASSLRQADGVATVDTTFNALSLPNATAHVTVKTRPGVTVAQLEHVITVTRNGASRAKFPTGLLTLSIRSAGLDFDQSRFAVDTATVDRAVSLGHSIHELTGVSVTVQISDTPEGYSSTATTILLRPTSASTTANLAFVRSYPRLIPGLDGKITGTPDVRWMLPALSAAGSLPDRKSLDALVATAGAVAVTGPVDATVGTTGASLSWAGEHGQYASIGAFFSPGQVLPRAADEARTDSVAGAIIRASATSNLGIQNIHIVSSNGQTHTLNDYELHLGPCAHSAGGADSQAWPNRLREAGIIIPPGSGSGQCTLAP